MDLIVIDLTAQNFLSESIRQACDQGAFYLKVSEIDVEILERCLKYSQAFFTWDGKLDLGFDQERFVGYSCKEITDGQEDQKETFDWASEVSEISNTPKSWEQLRGPSRWPSEAGIPGFKSALNAFEGLGEKLSVQLLDLFGLTSLHDLYDEEDERPQYRMKLVHYPKLSEHESSQGCGNHTDRAEWLTLIYECGQAGLEIELNGIIVSVPPKLGHLIVVFGQPLEDCTAKNIKAGQHRVTLSDKGDRYSLIFFMACAHHLSVADIRRKLHIDHHGASTVPLGTTVEDLYSYSYQSTVQEISD